MPVKCNNRKCKHNDCQKCGLAETSVKVADASLNTSTASANTSPQDSTNTSINYLYCNNAEPWPNEDMKEIMKDGVNPLCDRVRHRYKSKRQDGILMK
ncbi:hypothetical protein Ga0466249_002266 [Sporomusaceae bacterium BoRhaA]|uniref:hypothetical protein n=1 Tax=Pelorhabdus rhamnosifermentans TaxID=2772457 RepID=UPI001C062792|nr:hypothetical protein [Pelorhabdus rhamnosifermentans]MBU2701152.1 hypothetical protein [Pelorhabdus rhamnosifermentans]